MGGGGGNHRLHTPQRGCGESGLRQAVVLMEILKANKIHSAVKLDKT